MLLWSHGARNEEGAAGSGLSASTIVKVALGLVTPLLGAGILAGVAARAGRRATRGLRRLQLDAINAAAGSVISAGTTLVAVWLIGSMVASGPWPAVARAVQNSAVLRTIDDTLPATPSVLARIQRLVDRTGSTSAHRSPCHRRPPCGRRPTGRGRRPSASRARAAAASWKARASSPAPTSW